MTKLVNLVLHGKPITCLKHPITRNMEKIYLTTDDIKKILQTSNATVREVFPNGSTYDLTLENYDKADLFEVAKQEKQNQTEEQKAKNIEEARIQASIKAAKDARKQAIANIIKNRNQTIEQVAQEQAANTATNETNSAVEAAREQIETNKNL